MNEIEPKKPQAPAEEGRADDFFQSVIEQAPPYLAEILKASTGLAGGMLAAAAPHLATLVLTYRQKRAERNMARLFHELQDRSATIEERLSKLEAALRHEVRDRVFPALLDFAFEEREEDKIRLFVAGFVVCLQAQRPTSPSLLFTQYAELLAQLSVVEVQVLSDMSFRRKRGRLWGDMYPGNEGHLKARALTTPSFELIQQKLCRLNLLKDENEEKLHEQVELHDKLIERLLDKHVSVNRSSSDNLGFYSKPYSAKYLVTETGDRLLTFCETESDLG
ncbi:MAG: hypothetical protein SF051_05285 [Elusimicrobiota bacterium]|nr:hypothetical protein [Elusimicrobiota bacterium]